MVRLYIALGRKILKGDFECEAVSVRSLLEFLRRRFGRQFEQEVYDGTLKEGHGIVLNQKPLTPNQIDMPLADGDSVFIFTALTGG